MNLSDASLKTSSVACDLDFVCKSHQEVSELIGGLGEDENLGRIFSTSPVVVEVDATTCQM